MIAFEAIWDKKKIGLEGYRIGPNTYIERLEHGPVGYEAAIVKGSTIDMEKLSLIERNLKMEGIKCILTRDEPTIINAWKCDFSLQIDTYRYQCTIKGDVSDLYLQSINGINLIDCTRVHDCKFITSKLTFSAENSVNGISLSGTQIDQLKHLIFRIPTDCKLYKDLIHCIKNTRRSEIRNWIVKKMGCIQLRRIESITVYDENGTAVMIEW